VLGGVEDGRRLTADEGEMLQVPPICVDRPVARFVGVIHWLLAKIESAMMMVPGNA
jgi:hypothetical protein